MQPECAPKQPIETSIFKYYKPGRLLKYTERNINKGGTERSAKEYISLDTDKLVLEYVFKTPYTDIEYYLDTDPLTGKQEWFSAGVSRPISETYKQEAVNKGFHLNLTKDEEVKLGFDTLSQFSPQKLQKLAREVAEGITWSNTILPNIEKYNTAFWISPPEWGREGFGDYLFLFVFKKVNDRITVEVHNLKETKDFATSLFLERNILQDLHEKDTDFIQPSTESLALNDKRFLLTPILANISPKELDQLLTRVGIGDIQREVGRAHKKLLDHDYLYQLLKNNYIESVLHSYKNPTPAVIGDLKRKITAIYNRVEAIHKNGNITQLDKTLFSTFTPKNVQELEKYILQTAYAHYNKKPAMVQGGGSCPSDDDDTNNIDPFTETFGGRLTYSSAKSLLKKNKENSSGCNQTGCDNKSDHFHCPKEVGGCGESIKKGEEITKCPNPKCGLTKEQAAERSGTQCD